MQKITDTCPCCNSPADEPQTSPAYTFCTRCGHRWREPVETGPRYYEALVERNDPQAPWFARKIAERSDALASLLTPRVQRILEVGCAEGKLGEVVKGRFSLEYDGVELSQDRELARARLNQVFGTPAGQVQSSPYDLIISFHVLEHIARPQEELRAWSGLLAPGGRILIEVPNQAGHPLLVEDRNPEHLHQFTPTSLTLLLDRSGFTCEKLTTGHYESPVYPDSIRVLAHPVRQDATRRAALLRRFRDRIDGPFVAYGIGGDFLNYVAPVVESLPLVALLDSSPAKWGQRFADHAVTAYDPQHHAGLPILVCSIRYGGNIRQQLISMGIAPELIIGLESVYEGT